MDDLNIEEYAEKLNNELKEFRIDEDTLIKLTVEHPFETRIKMKSQYKRSYGQDLLDVLKSKLNGPFLDLMIGLYTELYEYDAEECHKAIEGLVTDSDTLIEIIVTRPTWMLKKLKETYKNNYNTELENDIKKETSEDFQKLLVTLLNCNKSQNKEPNNEKCSEIVQELYNEEEKLRTDVKIFNKYIGNCSPIDLMFIAREYHKKSKHNLIKEIEKEFSGDTQKLIKTVFYANISPSEYFATRIMDSVKDRESKEKILNRVIVSRNEIDIKIIKEYYKLLYQKDMVDDIISDTSGSYRKLLEALINK